MTDGQRAEVLRTLGRLLRSGIDWDRALRIAAGQAGESAGERLARARRDLLRGRAVADVLRASGVITVDERAYVASGLETGHAEDALEAIADAVTTRRLWRRRIGQRLIAPVALLVVALVVGPLPVVAGGQLAIGDYLFDLVAQLVLLAWLLIAAFRWAGWVVTQARDWRLRVTGRPTLAQRDALVRELASLLAAGLSAERALICVAGTSQGALAQRLEQARSLAAGRGLVAALVAVGALDCENDQPALIAAEQAGRLAAGLTHHGQLLSDALARRREVVAEWLPRGVYFAVIAWLVGGTFGGALVLPG